MQTTNRVLMVKPIRFSYNEQTAGNNAFQEKGYADDCQKKALKEFDEYVRILREAGIEVTVVEDTPEPHTPDSIFPNNWISLHSLTEMNENTYENDETKGTMVLYPMFAPNRRLERKPAVFEALEEEEREIIDLTVYENKNMFLEGTGSMILDRENKIVYACISPRTNEEVLNIFADKLGYNYCLFHAEDSAGQAIYHTNVMMSIGSKCAVVCLDAIKNIGEREHVIELLEEAEKEIVEISLEQMCEYAGNMLELRDKNSNPVLVMSARAKASLDANQLSTLTSYCKIIAPDLDTIERNGGGSARCMLAEIF